VRRAGAGVSVSVAAAYDLERAEGASRQLTLPLLVSGPALAVAEVAELSEIAGHAGDAAADLACPARIAASA